MKDLNFFEPYLTKEQKSEERKPLYTFLKIASALLLIAIPSVFYGLTILDIQATARMNQELATPEMREKLQRVETKQAKVNTMIAILPLLKQADSVLKGTEGVTDRLLQDVVDAIPPNVRFDKLSLSGSEVKIGGTAKNRFDVAELEYNLRRTGHFKQLLLDTVEVNSEGFGFTMTLIREGGKTGETDQAGK